MVAKMAPRLSCWGDVAHSVHNESSRLFRTQSNSTAYRVALVAPGTAPHNEARPSHGRLTSEIWTHILTYWRFGHAGSIFYYQMHSGEPVSKAVKKAISLPADLAAEVEAIAREENRSLSAVVQDALRAFKRTRLRGEFKELQGYWSNRARAAGVLSKRDLERLLRR